MLENEVLMHADSVVSGRRCFFAAVTSIIVFFIIVVIGGLTLPNDANAWKLLGVVAFSICSVILATWIPKINTFNMPSIKMIVVSISVGAAFNYLNYLMGSNNPFGHEYVGELQSYGLSGRIFYVLIICLLVPVSEEIYFRGLLFPIISLRIGAPAGAILSAILFALGHMSLHLLGVAIIYTYLVYRTKSVFTSMCAHITYNSIWIVRALISHS